MYPLITPFLFVEDTFVQLTVQLVELAFTIVTLSGGASGTEKREKTHKNEVLNFERRYYLGSGCSIS